MNAYSLDEDGQAAPIHGHITALSDVQQALSTIIYDKIEYLSLSLSLCLFKNAFVDDKTRLYISKINAFHYLQRTVSKLSVFLIL